jgi:hypothetical protein
MNVRRITQILLLLFVAVGIVFAIANVAGWNSGATSGSLTSTTGVGTMKNDGPWVAYFFHAKHRCPTCQTIESYAREALMPEIERGEIAWHVADYTAAENRPLVDQLDVMTSTVVLAHQENGRIVRFKNIEDDVWKHVSNHDAFLKFMRQAVQEFRKES